MGIEFVAVNHVGLVVRDKAKAERFYMEILGLRRHHTVDSWLMASPSFSVHLIEIAEATLDTENLFHAVNHVAFQVADLASVLRRLIDQGCSPFQMDFEGNEKQITAADDPLDFGIGTLFVQDEDGNLLEFLEAGRGIFGHEMLQQ